jgi:hypothetical protein
MKNRFEEFYLGAHNKFFHYFAKQWLENEEIPVALCSCYYRRHRTSNALEGWDNKANSYFERPHPNIKKYWAAYKKMQKIATTFTRERF